MQSITYSTKEGVRANTLVSLMLVEILNQKIRNNDHMNMLPVTGYTDPNLQVGSKTQDGLTVTRIYGMSAHFVVYETIEAGVGIQYSNEVGVGAHSAKVRFDEVSALISSECPKHAQRTFHSQSARALCSCFYQASYGKSVSTEVFDKIVDAIFQVKTSIAKRSYVMYACSACALVSVAGLIALWIMAACQLHLGYFPNLLRGALCGSAGALFSVLIGCAQKKLSDELTTPDAINYQGVLRIIVGGLGGALAIAAIDSNQLFPWAKGLVPATVFICAGAGFVERMIPDLFSRESE